MSDVPPDLARELADRLKDLDPDLPQMVEKVLAEGDANQSARTRSFDISPDTAINLAQLLVETLALAVAAYIAFRKQGAKPDRQAVKRTIRIEIGKGRHLPDPKVQERVIEEALGLIEEKRPQ
ncbi:MAG: hypothetical protein JXQ73_32840 [Phycisphaerae bacterium]|nr:hypothetical protein [Phycisphaerae bacterium]